MIEPVHPESHHRPRRALLVDDDDAVRAVLAEFLRRVGCTVVEAPNGEVGLERVMAERFDVAIVDVRMPGISGIELTRQAKEARPGLHVVIITADPSVDTAVQAFKQGADDFLPKPLRFDELRVILDQLPIPPADVTGAADLPWVLGDSPAIHAVYQKIRRVAATGETALILGESGTGKELAARAIHFWSRRKGKPFVPVNCSSVAEGVLENELFGHESEAFTGASGRKKGLIEEADGGILFLDEIGDSKPSFQMALLRFLQQSEVRRLGSTKTHTVDVRVIAATNKDLERAVSDGTFRKDLFYRLDVLPIEMPPLRRRPSDIPILVDHFVRRFGGPGRGLCDEGLRALQRCRWPGNVRELENLIRRLLVTVEHDQICLDDLPARYRQTPTDGVLTAGSFREAKEIFERNYIETLLQRVGGNIAAAAREAGLGRPYFHEKIKKFGINPNTFRDQQSPPPIA